MFWIQFGNLHGRILGNLSASAPALKHVVYWWYIWYIIAIFVVYHRNIRDLFVVYPWYICGVYDVGAFQRLFHSDSHHCASSLLFVFPCAYTEDLVDFAEYEWPTTMILPPPQSSSFVESSNQQGVEMSKVVVRLEQEIVSYFLSTHYSVFYILLIVFLRGQPIKVQYLDLLLFTRTT